MHEKIVVGDFLSSSYRTVSLKTGATMRIALIIAYDGLPCVFGYYNADLMSFPSPGNPGTQRVNPPN